MRYYLFILLLIIVSCSKKTAHITELEIPEKIDFDTTAVDSFAPGATPNNVKEKIILVKDSATEAKRKELEKKIKDLEKKADDKKKTDN